MECRTKRWLSGWAALLLLIPGVIASQTTTTTASKPQKTEVDRLIFKGVKSIDVNDLKLSLYTDQSHCNSWILTPFCLVTHNHYIWTRKYLDHDQLKRDVLRARVYYWLRGFREADVDTTVVPKGEDDAIVTFNITEGPPTIITDIGVTQDKNVLSPREISDRMLLAKGSRLNVIRLDSTRVFLQQRLWD